MVAGMPQPLRAKVTHQPPRLIYMTGTRRFIRLIVAIKREGKAELQPPRARTEREFTCPFPVSTWRWRTVQALVANFRRCKGKNRHSGMCPNRMSWTISPLVGYATHLTKWWFFLPPLSNYLKCVYSIKHSRTDTYEVSSNPISSQEAKRPPETFSIIRKDRNGIQSGYESANGASCVTSQLENEPVVAIKWNAKLFIQNLFLL